MPADRLIRAATVADIRAIAAIRDGNPEAGPADPRMAAYLQGSHHPQFARAPRVMYLATRPSVVIGYIAGHLTRRFDCDGELHYLYVAPSERRTGVASALLRRLAQWIETRQALRVCVDVNADSAGAQAFYERHGARPLRHHWLFWPDIKTVLERR